MTGAKYTPPLPFPFRWSLPVGDSYFSCFTPPGDSRQWTRGPDTSLNVHTPDTLGAGKLHLEFLLHTPITLFPTTMYTPATARKRCCARSPSNPSNSQLGQTGPVSCPVQLAICPQSSGPPQEKTEESRRVTSGERGYRPWIVIMTSRNVQQSLRLPNSALPLSPKGKPDWPERPVPGRSEVRNDFLSFHLPWRPRVSFCKWKERKEKRERNQLRGLSRANPDNSGVP